MIFAVEPLEACWNEIYGVPDGLAYQHWNETQLYRGEPYNPLFERYNQYAKAGWFLQFVARDNGKAVGYGGAYIVPSMHSQRLIATEDTWYLVKEYRKGWNAIKFYRFMEKVCTERGAENSTLTLPEDKGLDPIVRRLGYAPKGRIFFKPLAAEF